MLTENALFPKGKAMPKFGHVSTFMLILLKGHYLLAFEVRFTYSRESSILALTSLHEIVLGLF